jgi:hypothetical protein
MDPRARQLISTRRHTGRIATGFIIALAVTAAFSGPASAQDAQTVADDESTRAILLVVGGLVAMGLLLTAVTVWFWRSTRPDHPALGPLEVMGDRRFTSRSAFEQRQILDGVRPDGAEVTRTMPADDAFADRGDAALDLQRLVVETPTSFDDLVEPAPATPRPAEQAEQGESAAASPVEEPPADVPLAPEVPAGVVSDPLRIVEPPVVEPAVVEPPAVEAAVVEAAVVEPAVADPPIAESPTAEPPVAEAPVVELVVVEAAIAVDPGASATSDVPPPPPPPPPPAVPADR